MCLSDARPLELGTSENTHTNQLMLFEVLTLQVYVNMMMPLDTINLDGSVKNLTYVTQSLEKLKKAGTHGIMLDIWWGIAEKDEPGKYNFNGYYKIVEAAKNAGLTL